MIKIEPIKEVQFAARLGFLSKALWMEFYGRGTHAWRMRCWRKLTKSGVFKKHRLVPDILLLNSRNRFVSNHVDSIARPPYANQIFHDEIVGRSFIIIRRTLTDWHVWLEADLKKTAPLRNKGKRISQQTKHPDLFLSGKEKRIAVEIELTTKSLGRYVQMLRSYRAMLVHAIVFVVRSNVARMAIKRAAIETRFPDLDIVLGFCPLEKWKLDPFSAEVEVRGEFKPFTQILRK